MLKKILSYGAAAGLVVGALMLVTMIAMKDRPLPTAWSMAIGYLTMLVALSAVFIAIKRHRDLDLGGVIRFWPAFGLGLGVSAVAGIFYVLAWEVTLAATDLDIVTMMVAQKQAEGASAAELAKFKAEMAEFAVTYANPLVRLPITFSEIFPVGLLVSLISAAILRNAPPRTRPARPDTRPASSSARELP